MNLSNHLIAVILVFTVFNLHAQNKSTLQQSSNVVITPKASNREWSCGYDDYGNDLTPEQKMLQEHYEEQLVKILESDPNHFRGRQATYTVPVVVHIIHNGGYENLSDERVAQGIEMLNESFANISYYDQGSGAITDIEFCLARQDPDGQITNGITRTVSELTSMDKNTQDDDLKALIQWDPNCYINIWLVKEIIGGVAGYAYYPSAHGESFDGIVSEARWIGDNHWNNGVLTHEMGHYLGLHHTWKGGCTNNNCLYDGDQVCDTPPDNSTSPFPCDAPPNTCNTDTNSGFTTDQNDLIQNYMDYGDLECWHDFTPGQSDRMLYFLTEVRSSLLNCPSCSDPCPVDLSVEVTPSTLAVEVGSIATVSLDAPLANQYNWYRGDTLVSTSPTLDYFINSSGDFELIVQVLNDDPNCVAYDTLLITPFCDPSVQIIASADYLDVIAGEPTLMEATAINSDSIIWNLEGQTIGTGPQIEYAFQDPGVFELMIEAITPYNGCSALDTISVSITCPVEVGLELPFPFQTVQANYPITLVADTTSAIGVQWFLNGVLLSNSDTLTHTFNEFGLFNLEVVAQGISPGCSTYGNIQVEVICESQLSIEVTEQFVNIGNGTQFTASGDDILSYAWYVNGELSSTEAVFNPTFNEIGSYEVYLIASYTNCDQRSESIIITVQEPCNYDSAENAIRFEGMEHPREIVESPDDDGFLLVFANGILKVDFDYQVIWSVDLYSTEILDVLPDTINGGFYIAYYDFEDFLPIIAKVDAAGFIIWEIGQEMPVNYGPARVGKLLMDTNGDVYLYANSTIYLSIGYNHAYIVKVTPDGQEIWSKEFANYDMRNAFVTSTNDVLILGIDDINRFSIMKLDEDGNFIWTNRYFRSIDYSFIGAGLIEEYDNGNYLVLFNPFYSGLFNQSTYLNITPNGDVVEARVVYDKDAPFEHLNHSGICKMPNGNFLISTLKPGTFSVPSKNLIIRLAQDNSIVWARENPEYDKLNGPLIIYSNDKIITFGGNYIYHVLFEMDENGFAESCPVSSPQIRQFDVTYSKSPASIQTMVVSYWVDRSSPGWVSRDYERIVECATNAISNVDIHTELLNASICDDSVTFEVYICNEGNITVPANLPFRIYDGSPLENDSSPISFSSEIGQAIAADSCYQFTVTIPHEFDKTPYFMFNDDGSGSLPFDFQNEFPLTAYTECNYVNNLDSISLDGLAPPPAPEINLGADTILCDGQNILLEAAPGFDSYLWQDGSTMQNYLVTTPGLYIVEAKLACRQAVKDSIYIDAPVLPGLDLGPDQSGCQNSIFYLEVDVGFYSYLWQDGSTEPSFSAWEPGIYWVEATDICSNVYRDSVEITIEDGYIIDLGGPIELCSGDSVEVNITSNYTSFNWTPDSFISCNDCPSVTIKPDTTTRYTLTANNGNCFSADTLSIIVLPDYLISDTLLICEGDTIELFNQQVFQSGIYEYTYSSLLGCDSTIQYVVEAIPPISTNENIATCKGSPVDVFGLATDNAGTYTQTYLSINACDSIHHITLTTLDTFYISEALSLCAGDSISLFGQVISQGGVYQNTFTAANGCDSTHQHIVSILDTIFTQEDIFICAGEEVDIFGQMVSTAEDYATTFSAENGCDSVHTISLAILDTLATFENIQLCYGDSLFVGNEWVSGTGVYSITYSSVLGCDSTHYTSISMLDTFNTTENVSICAGETITVFGQPISEAGMYSQTYTSFNGCDSTHIIMVEVLDTVLTTEQISICIGDSIFIFGQFVDEGGIYEATFSSVNGCDSTHVVTIEMLDTLFVSEQMSLCEGDSISLFGQFIHTAGIYEATFASINGCDSTHQVILSIVDTLFSQEEQSICAGESIEIFGQLVNTPGIYSAAFVAENGCDSVHTISLAVLDTLATFETIDLCEGDSVFVAGEWIVEEGEYSSTYTSILGCDSTHYTTISILDTVHTYEMLSLCAGDSILIFGEYESTTESFVGEFTGANGCDSIHVINLAVNPAFEEVFPLSHCEGDSSLVFGQYQTEAGIYTQTYSSQYGCDSTVTFELAVEEATIAMSGFSSPCPGEENGSILIGLQSGISPHNYEWAHTSENVNHLEGLSTGDYFVTITGANGCFDTLSIRITEEVAPDYTLNTVNVSCYGLTDGQLLINSTEDILYSLDGSTFVGDPVFNNLPGGPHTLYLQTFNGCIHTTMFDVIAPPPLVLNLGNELTIAPGESIQLQPTGDINLFTSYLWTPGEWLSCNDCLNPIAAPQQSQVYLLTAQTGAGCSVSDSISIQVDLKEEIYFPNVFSPNADGRNDRFRLYTDIDLQVLEFQVFDRWGSLIYEERNKKFNDLNGWDGTSNQEAVPVGVYVYRAKIQFPGGKVLELYGDVTLLR